MQSQKVWASFKSLSDAVSRGDQVCPRILAEKQPALKNKNPNDLIDARFVRKLEEEGFFKKFSTK